MKWVSVVGYEGLYEVSNIGLVKSLLPIGDRWAANRIMSLKNKDGYRETALTKNKVRKHFRVHRLVAFAFIPNPENKPHVNHINGIRDDNRVENLEWCTNAENIRHAYRIGLAVAMNGEDSGQSKLTNQQVLQIFNSDKTQCQLAAEFGLNQSSIGFIKTGWTWGHVTGKNYKRVRK